MSGFILCTVFVFAFGLATMHQIHINRQLKVQDLKEDYHLKAKAQKKLWDSNFAESEKLFEKGADGCKN